MSRPTPHQATTRMTKPTPHQATTRTAPPLKSRTNNDYTDTPFHSEQTRVADACEGVDWAECTTHPILDTIAGEFGEHVD